MTSIMDALNTSESSLQMIEQQTNLISNNIANASTPGYVQEELPQSAAVGVGAAYGVLAEPIQRMTDAAASATANQAAGSAAYSTEMVNVLTPYTTTLGQASDSTTLPAVLSAFSSALTTLSVTPSDATAQGAAATSAQTVATTLNSLDSAVSSARETADQGVGSGVAAVNSTLNQLAQNQTSLQLAAANGESTAPFLDTQDRLIANMSSDLPVTVLQSGSNNVVVTTDQGTTLFDGTAHLLSFTATPNISSTTTAASLGAVTVNGQPIAMSQSGSIAADLQLRNVTLPGFSSQLDQIAGNLITAFQTADPTANAATSSTGTALAGLFVQSSGSTTALSSPTSVAGLAGTIAVNTAVSDNPALLQSGVNGTPSGSTASDNSTVLAFVNALQASAGSSYTASGLPASMTPSDAAAQIAGLQQNTLTEWTTLNTSRTTQASSAQTALSGATGVSVDDQLQRLMIVQQTYAASAQVIQAASNMLNSLIQSIQ